MHIVQIANFVKPDSGGLRRCLAELRREYEQRGHKVSSVFPAAESFALNAASASLKGTCVPFTGGYRAIVARQPLRNLLLELAPDVVELSDKTTLAWLPEWLSERRIPTVVISHERTDIVIARYAPRFLPIAGFVERWREQLVHSADAIVCASRFAAAEFASSAIGANKVRLVPLGVDLETFVPDWSTPDHSEPVIVICARLSTEKHPDIAIGGFIELLKRRSAKLVVIGDGPMRADLEALCVGLPVSFLGFVSDPTRIAEIYRVADVALNLGPIETFGLATLEFLASGVPVVVSNQGGSRELVDADCGRAVPPDEISIANAIDDLLSMPLEFRRHAARSRANLFPWSRTAESLLRLYTVLGTRRRSERVAA